MIMVRRYSYLRSRLNGTIDQRSSFVAIRHEIIRKGSKNALCISLISVFLLFLMSCVSQQSILTDTDNLTDYERAQYTLMEFLKNLQNGKYDKAAQFYGGSYQTMIDHNPDTDSNDHKTLLRNACTLNGMQCLRAKIIGLEEEVPNEKYVFLVEFLEHNGTLFTLGPCCGGDEASSPPQSVFLFTVIKTDQNKFIVMDMPPYAP
jgi:hypothetical protein